MIPAWDNIWIGGLTDDLDEMAIFVEFHDAAVAVAVSYKEIAGAISDRNRGWHAKVRVVFAGLHSSAKNQIRFGSIGRKLKIKSIIIRIIQRYLTHFLCGEGE